MMSATRDAEPLARFRGSLDQDRPALRRARHDERAAHAEVPALVVDRMDPVTVGEDREGLIADEGTVLPAVPQLEQDVDELLGPLVPGVMVG